ncbi:hypothetical protein EWM64_g6898 [Hericium alpestre]|uniref:Uncharacterized protein n=1 Tax=Hericium alpestre TaxID=135208 RepID=A0A4Y9ZSA0_9AGAM|nr:hypothetical protein EWM64_g6898 [Hericium alpestre]
MIHADYLFLLTDVDGLYTANPRKDPTAKLVEIVSSVAAVRAEVSTATLGSSLGTGGVATIITSSKRPETMYDIIEYDSAREPLSRPESPSPSARASPERTALARPPHTLFTPSETPLRDVKAWTSHTLNPAGSVIIDAGAHKILAKRESGGRLLAAGVLGVRGHFASGQAVKIMVRRRPDGGVEDTDREAEHYSIGTTTTQPGTPNLMATASMSSSISSLGTLSCTASGTNLTSLGESGPLGPLPEDDTVVMEGEDESEKWELEEVGRGLANYNWAQIAKVKGLNSSYIPQLLGYADTEYVVENITIRVPP